MNDAKTVANFKNARTSYIAARTLFEALIEDRRNDYARRAPGSQIARKAIDAAIRLSI